MGRPVVLVTKNKSVKLPEPPLVKPPTDFCKALVLPKPRIVLVNETISKLFLLRRLSALPLIETVTSMLSQPAKVPLDGEIVSQLALLLAAQVKASEPAFVTLL